MDKSLSRMESHRLCLVHVLALLLKSRNTCTYTERVNFRTMHMYCTIGTTSKNNVVEIRQQGVFQVIPNNEMDTDMPENNHCLLLRLEQRCGVGQRLWGTVETHVMWGELLRD